MSITIPAGVRDLLDKPIVVTLATLMPDGSPQSTPVWFNYDRDRIKVNSAKGRMKDKNMRRDPRVALTIVDPENPYRYLEIRGRVENISEAEGHEHIDFLAKRYLNEDTYPFRQPGEVRVVYTIAPESITSMARE
jgi:PPOX class probable F420-dependent enzyme